MVAYPFDTYITHMEKKHLYHHKIANVIAVRASQFTYILLWRRGWNSKYAHAHLYKHNENHIYLFAHYLDINWICYIRMGLKWSPSPTPSGQYFIINSLINKYHLDQVVKYQWIFVQVVLVKAIISHLFLQLRNGLTWPNQNNQGKGLGEFVAAFIFGLIWTMFTQYWLIGPGNTVGRQIIYSTLARVMTSCLAAPSHYLSQCWLINHGFPWNLPWDNSTENHPDVND